MQELFRRKYLISFFYLIVCLVGYSAWKDIPIENAPELNLPSLTVSYGWGTTAPEIMEQEITRKVESAANRLRDVAQINSVSQEGRSSVTIRFYKNAPVEFRALELREYLYVLEETLPPNINPARITRQVPEELEDQQTFMVFTLSGDMDARELLEYARQSIKPKLLGLEGLGKVDLQGVMDPALMIEFDREALEKFGLSGREVGAQVMERLSWRSSGFTEAGSERYSLIVPPEYENTVDISNMKIGLAGTLKQLYLSDIADISIQDYPVTSLKRVNGSPALTIDLVKEGGADAMGIARQVLDRADEIRSTLPEGMTLRLQVDSTERLREQFDMLALQAIFSAILVFLVVLLFIRKLRAPIVIIGSVVFSMLMSLTVLYFLDYTLNVITLAGLTIALGMLIDNAVVVFEQVNPGIPKERQSRIEYIRKELPKAVVPVLGSTFTTVGIFIPLLFALDELRLFLLPLAIALTITLLSSVIISFTWIPYALIWLTPFKTKVKRQKAKGKRFRWQRLFLQAMVLRNRIRWIFILTLIGLIGLPLFLIEAPADWEDTAWPEFTQSYFDNRNDIDPWIGGLTYRFVKDTYFGNPWRGRSQEFISVSIRSPQGTPLSEIDKIVSNYEKLAKPYEQAFDYYEAQMSEYYGASMRFAIKPEYLYESDPYMFFGEAMYLAARTGNVGISVSGFNDGISTGFGGNSSSHRIRVTGYSYNELEDLAREIGRRLSTNRRVQDIDINTSSWYSRGDFYQYELNLNEEKMMAMGLSPWEVRNALRIDIDPQNTLGKVEFQGQEMYLIARSGAERYYEENLMESFRQADSASFSLAAIGAIEKRKALTEIRRTDQSYERTISLNFLGNFRMARNYIESVLEEVPVPVGAKIHYGNALFNSDNDEQARNLWLIAMLSLLSVWMIVSALLESWSGPFFVLLTIPFSGLGIMLGTLTNDLAFDRGAIAGALLCMGVVVNNAILLIHQKEQEHTAGVRGLRCWANIFRKRIRAILITTTTTIAGLMPMIVYGSNEFWQSLAVIVCWGLLFSTGLILLMAGVHERKLIRFRE